MDKPVFYIPSMKEIKDIPWNGKNVVSTFSGTGGSCLGYRQAGYKVIWANEFISHAQQCYKANHRETILNTLDIREVKPEDILNSCKLDIGEIDLFDGSPPCSNFSVATGQKRSKNWGVDKKYSNKKQRVDDLFFEYTRLLKYLQPKVFIAENVSGLIEGIAKGYFIEIFKALKECGYKVEARVLDAKFLGVPQSRERLIFIGVRNDLNIEISYPDKLPYEYNFRDAVGNLGDDNSEFYSLEKTQMKELWEMTKYQDNFMKASQILYGRKAFFSHRRMSWDTPITTVTQGGSSLYHPDYPRTLTINEIKRCSTFPDDFMLFGTFQKKWERIGRAVPPRMMENVSRNVFEKMLSKL